MLLLFPHNEGGMNLPRFRTGVMANSAARGRVATSP